MKKLIILLLILLIPSGVLGGMAIPGESTSIIGPDGKDVQVTKSGQLSTTDVLLEFSKGNVEGHYTVNKFGSSSFIQETPTDVWDRDSTPWLAPTDARIHAIASSVDNDTATTGNGAWTLRIYGLQDWDSKETTEDIIMAGTTPVNTDNSYVIIHRMIVLTTGSTGPFSNVGLITATTIGEPSGQTVTAQIAAIKGQTQMAIYGIPSTQTLYMYNFSASIAHLSPGVNVDSAGVIIMQSTDIENSKTAYTFKHTASIQDNGITTLDSLFLPPKRFEGPCIIKIQMVASNEDSFCDASFDGVLVDNGF